MSKLNHQNILKLYGIVTDPFQMVLEYCPLPDLFKHLHDENLLSKEKFSLQLQLKFCYDISCAISYLHSQSPPIVHLDLRSPNIVIFDFLNIFCI